MSLLQTISPQQRNIFFASLYRTTTYLGKHTKEEVEEYRKKIMREELGVDSLTVANGTKDLDKLLKRLAVDRCDYEAAIKLSQGDVKRLRYCIFNAAEKINKLRGSEPYAGEACDYVAGVLRQAGFSTMTGHAFASKLKCDDGWLDFTEKQMKTVLQILQKHLRRLENKEGK